MALTNTGGFSNLIEYGALIKKFYVQGLDGKIPDLQKNFFTVQGSKSEHEDLLTIQDSEPIGQFTGELEYDQFRETYRKRITNTEYARGLAIQRRLWEVGNKKAIGALSQHFGEKVKLRRLIDAFALFNNAFNTTYTGGDGLALCSTAHTSGGTGSNQINSASLELSPAAVITTKNAMVKFNTNADNPLFVTKPDTIIVPEELEDYANEISKSRGKVDSANNNINTSFGQYKVISSRIMDDTNNWFMANQDRMKRNQQWFEVVRHEFGRDKDWGSLALRWYVYMFYGFGFSEWDHIYGHNPS